MTSFLDADWSRKAVRNASMAAWLFADLEVAEADLFGGLETIDDGVLSQLIERLNGFLEARLFFQRHSSPV